MSRLLTLLLLYRAGYHIGKYVSIEKLIERTKGAYYDDLQESSENWHEGTNNYIPFVTYQLGVILAAYREFSDRVKIISENTRKPDRIREIIHDHLGKITKAEIMAQCPDISKTTVERALTDLVKSGEVIKIGGGRYTSYTWNREID
jgi:Fic family protein